LLCMLPVPIDIAGAVPFSPPFTGGSSCPPSGAECRPASTPQPSVPSSPSGSLPG
jgi:hypothetical protein